MNIEEISRTIRGMKISKRKDGRFEGRITINDVRKGFYGSTKAEVKTKAKNYLMKIENGFNEEGKIILNDYIEYWLKTYKWNKIEPTSFSRLHRVYVHQIKDTVGTMKVNEITTKDIQRLIDNHANPPSKDIKPLAMSGLKRLIQLLRPCFRCAVMEGLISSNPCDNVIMPKASCIQTETKVQFTLTDDEIKVIREEALAKYRTNEYKSRDAFVLLLIINLGLRVGEVLALEWDDFDLINKVVTINKTIQSNITNFNQVNGDNVTYNRLKKSPKTNAGIRTIKLSDNVIWYIQELKEYDKRNNIKSQYVCCTSVGTLNTSRNLQRSLDRIIKRTGIKKRVTLHTLRHTFGSTLLRRGVNIEVVSSLLGHSNITITYNKYIHSIKEEEAKAMDMVNVC